MFDNTKPNVILLADRTSFCSQEKNIAPYKVAKALRDAGFEVAVINHLSVFTIDEIKKILQQLISDKTLFVGVSNLFYLDISKPNWASGVDRWRASDLGMFLPHGKKYKRQWNIEIKLFRVTELIAKF